VAPLALLALAACSAGTARPDNPAAAAAQSAARPTQAGDIEMSLAPAAEKELVGNRRFDRTRLLHTVRQALVAHNVLTQDVDTTRPKVEIRITDINVQSNVFAIVFAAHERHIEGDVIIRSPAGGELRQFQVSASSALGDAGQDEAQMDWLYRSFAWLLVHELGGGA
jgi:hypothetical protein